MLPYTTACWYCLSGWEDNLQELVFSFHLVGIRNETRVIRALAARASTHWAVSPALVNSIFIQTKCGLPSACPEKQVHSWMCSALGPETKIPSDSSTGHPRQFNSCTFSQANVLLKNGIIQACLSLFGLWVFPSSEPVSLPEPLFDFCSFIQGFLVEEVCLPMCVYVHTHVCVCVPREESPLVLCCCYDVRAESHSPLQSFPSSDAAISRLLIKRH